MKAKIIALLRALRDSSGSVRFVINDDCHKKWDRNGEYEIRCWQGLSGVIRLYVSRKAGSKWVQWGYYSLNDERFSGEDTRFVIEQAIARLEANTLFNAPPPSPSLADIIEDQIAPIAKPPASFKLAVQEEPPQLDELFELQAQIGASKVVHVFGAVYRISVWHRTGAAVRLYVARTRGADLEKQIGYFQISAHHPCVPVAPTSKAATEIAALIEYLLRRQRADKLAEAALTAEAQAEAIIAREMAEQDVSFDKLDAAIAALELDVIQAAKEVGLPFPVMLAKMQAGEVPGVYSRIYKRKPTDERTYLFIRMSDLEAWYLEQN